jgi:hypothetical protein
VLHADPNVDVLLDQVLPPIPKIDLFGSGGDEFAAVTR